VQDHDPAMMMAICPIHHHQATVGALDVNTQMTWKEKPFNQINGFAEGQLHVTTKAIAVEVGSNLLVGAGFKFVVDDKPILQLKTDREHRLLLSVDLYDPNDNLLIAIVDNEWMTGDPLPWDLQYGYNQLSLWRKSRDIGLSIDARQDPIKLRGNLWFRRQNYLITEQELQFNGVVSEVGFRNLGLVGMRLIVRTSTGNFLLDPEPRFGKGMIVGTNDMKKCLDAYQQLIRKTRVGRNEPCPCGSGLKAKRCCFR
jgi:hypothetical protein